MVKLTKAAAQKMSKEQLVAYVSKTGKGGKKGRIDKAKMLLILAALLEPAAFNVAFQVWMRGASLKDALYKAAMRQIGRNPGTGARDYGIIAETYGPVGAMIGSIWGGEKLGITSFLGRIFRRG